MPYLHNRNDFQLQHQDIHIDKLPTNNVKIPSMFALSVGQHLSWACWPSQTSFLLGTKCKINH